LFIHSFIRSFIYAVFYKISLSGTLYIYTTGCRSIQYFDIMNTTVFVRQFSCLWSSFLHLNKSFFVQRIAIISCSRQCTFYSTQEPAISNISKYKNADRPIKTPEVRRSYVLSLSCPPHADISARNLVRSSINDWLKIFGETMLNIISLIRLCLLADFT